MPRATSVIAASHRHDRPVADTVILDYAMRSAGEGVVTSVKGNTIEIHLHGGLRLRTDDLLVLDDGTLVEVVAAPEALIEARAADEALRDEGSDASRVGQDASGQDAGQGQGQGDPPERPPFARS